METETSAAETDDLATRLRTLAVDAFKLWPETAISFRASVDADAPDVRELVQIATAALRGAAEMSDAGSPLAQSVTRYVARRARKAAQADGGRADG